MEKTYKIIRFRFNGPNSVVKTGLTLEEAQAHCRREDTRGEGWFDGYDEENPDLAERAAADARLRDGIAAVNRLFADTVTECRHLWELDSTGYPSHCTVPLCGAKFEEKLQLERPTARCEADAQRGTGTGTCEGALDELGYCDRARQHVS